MKIFGDVYSTAAREYCYNIKHLQKTLLFFKNYAIIISMAKFKKSDYKKQKNAYSVMGKIGDILFYPIIILTLFCCFTIFTAKGDHKVPSIFGFSMVNISSGSMTKAGFEKHDMVFLKKKSPNNLRAGDIIAFYYASSGVTTKELTKIQTYDIGTHSVTYEFDKETFKELRAKKRTMKIKTVDEISKNTDIYFHRIVGIYMADDGTIFYKTEGDTNYYTTGPDALLIAESLVVGEYLYTPPVLRDIFHFLATSTGMLLVVVVPLGVLMLFMSFSIIEQISRMGIEKRVLRRELAYDDPESLKANIGIEMEMSDKVKFFATAETEERNAVSYFLWGYLGKNEEEQLTYQGIIHALSYLDEDPNKFWMYFVGLAKTKRQKKLMHKVWQEWIKEEKVKAITKKQKETNNVQKPAKAGKIIEGKQAPKRPQRSE